MFVCVCVCVCIFSVVCVSVYVCVCIFIFLAGVPFVCVCEVNRRMKSLHVEGEHEEGNRQCLTYLEGVKGVS